MPFRTIYGELVIQLRLLRPEDKVHEGDELGGPAPTEAVTDDLPAEDIQGGEQIRRAVPNVVLCALLGLPEGDRLQRLHLFRCIHSGDTPCRRKVVINSKCHSPCSARPTDFAGALDMAYLSSCDCWPTVTRRRSPATIFR